MRAHSVENVRGLRLVAASFIWLGLFWGGWAVVAFDVERSLGLNHAGFGLLLTAALSGAVVANFVAGSLAERWGTAAALSASLGVFGLVLGLLALTGQPAAFMVLFVLAVAASGCTDVTMNVAAAAGLGARPGQFAQFHGLFNGGAAAGAALMGGLLALGVSWRWGWALEGLAARPCPGRDYRARPSTRGPGWNEHPRSGDADDAAAGAALCACRGLRRGRDGRGGIEAWGVLFLRSQLALSAGLGTAASPVGQVLATLSRVALGPRAGAMAVGGGASTGAAVAAAGLTLEGCCPQRCPLPPSAWPRRWSGSRSVLAAPDRGRRGRERTARVDGGCSQWRRLHWLPCGALPGRVGGRRVGSARGDIRPGRSGVATGARRQASEPPS